MNDQQAAIKKDFDSLAEARQAWLDAGYDFVSIFLKVMQLGTRVCWYQSKQRHTGVVYDVNGALENLNLFVQDEASKKWRTLPFGALDLEETEKLRIAASE